MFFKKKNPKLVTERTNTYENRKIELLVAKHRAGSTGTVNLLFKMNTGKFDNYSNKEDGNE